MNISFRNGKYSIFKYKNGKNYYFGSYLTKADAENAWLFFESVGWDLSWRPNRKNRKTNSDLRYLSYRQGKWIIQKNGKHYGCFNSLSDAQAERDLLIEYDWNDDLLYDCE